LPYPSYPTPFLKAKIEAASGYHDDLVVVLATLIHALKGGRRHVLADIVLPVMGQVSKFIDSTERHLHV
jgi:hypothetical protein